MPLQSAGICDAVVSQFGPSDSSCVAVEARVVVTDPRSVRLLYELIAQPLADTQLLVFTGV
jgi:hypothetical protein